MRSHRGDSRPTLTRSDALLLTALMLTSDDTHPVSLPALLDTADYLDRLPPTYDEVSFGLPRLAAYLAVDPDPAGGLCFRALPEATRLRAGLKASAWIDAVHEIKEVLGTVPYPDPEPDEDRSLGRLPGLEAADVDAASSLHGEWVQRYAMPLIAAQGAEYLARLRKG
jgi:hypothetical protein